jgi:cytochrome b561
MGYYGGKGVPFFGLFTIPGKADKTKEDGAFAGKMFKWHKQAGSLLWYLIPLHLAGAAQHAVCGHAIFTRVNPLAPR